MVTVVVLLGTRPRRLRLRFVDSGRRDAAATASAVHLRRVGVPVVRPQRVQRFFRLQPRGQVVDGSRVRRHARRRSLHRARRVRAVQRAPGRAAQTALGTGPLDDRLRRVRRPRVCRPRDRPCDGPDRGHWDSGRRGLLDRRRPETARPFRRRFRLSGRGRSRGRLQRIGSPERRRRTHRRLRRPAHRRGPVTAVAAPTVGRVAVRRVVAATAVRSGYGLRHRGTIRLEIARRRLLTLQRLGRHQTHRFFETTENIKRF